MHSKIFRTMGAFALCAVMASPAFADVTLNSADGNIQIEGELLSFDGAQYVVRTNIGDVIVDAESVNCQGDACPGADGAGITMVGAENLAASLLPALLEGYSFTLDADALITANPGQGTDVVLDAADGRRLAEIRLNRADTTQAFEALAAGQTDLALVTREIAPDEAQLVAATGQGDLSGIGPGSIAALDGVIIVTNRDNAIYSLSESEIFGIFSGAITNWLELGGVDAPITVYARGPGTGTGSAFNAMVMAPNEAGIAPTAKLMRSDASLSDAVAADPTGIGFTSFSNLRNTRAVALRGSCGIQTPANAFTIKTEEYPYAQRIYSYLPQRDLPWVLEGFQKFLLSDDAQDVVRLAGYVDQAISEIPVNDQGLRFATAILAAEEEQEDGLGQLQDMVSQLIAATRLSVAFRFKKGSSEPDERAEGDLRRLATMIEAGRFAGKEILLVGFSDSYGDAEGNRALSLRRAEAARDALQALIGDNAGRTTGIVAQGYGELSPLGCDSTEAGREINRRVEVWLRDVALETGQIFKAD